MNDGQIPDFSSVSSPPRRNLNYETLKDSEIIGSGGQAVVRRARLSNYESPQIVAVKEPLSQAKTLDIETTEEFFAKARTWKRIDSIERDKKIAQHSEHIVGVIDIGEELPWIALEYMDGGGLDDRLAENPGGFPVDEALWIGECLCRGLKFAHGRGVAHLDLKPANVLFRETPTNKWDVPKIADWGLARLLIEDTGSVSALSAECAAPEQYDSDQFGDPDTYTDIFQVGTIMYTLLTGNPPYTGGQARIKHDVMSGNPPEPPSTRRTDIPPSLDAAVLMALEQQKGDRYSSISEFGQALHGIRTGESLPPTLACRFEESAPKRTTSSTDLDSLSKFKSEEYELRKEIADKEYDAAAKRRELTEELENDPDVKKVKEIAERESILDKLLRILS